jgi:uncharacterized membrane protein YphA (DoxX/SURF4 family)
MTDTMSRSRRLTWISTVVRVGLAGVMLYAGVAKLLEPGQALRAVQAYRILPPSIDDVFAVGLPLLEVTVGVLLLLGLGTRLAAWVAGGLMVVFIAGVASAWIRGLSIDCGCFGGGGDVAAAGKTWRYTSEILRDVGFLILAAWLIRFPKSLVAVDRVLDPGDLPGEFGQDGDDVRDEEPRA